MSKELLSLFCNRKHLSSDDVHREKYFRGDQLLGVFLFTYYIGGCCFRFINEKP